MIKTFDKYLSESAESRYLDEVDIFQDYIDEFGSIDNRNVEYGTRPSITKKGLFLHSVSQRFVSDELAINLYYYGDTAVDMIEKLDKMQNFLLDDFFPRINAIGDFISYKIECVNNVGYPRAVIEIRISKKSNRLHYSAMGGWSFYHDKVI